MHSHIILVPTLSSKVAPIKWSLLSWASAAEVCRETFFETKTEIFQDSKKISKRGFVSPIFGHQVKDIVTVPFTVKNTGDTTRRFDAFRTKHKMSDERIIIS